jgi:hypothetical protein
VGGVFTPPFFVCFPLAATLGRLLLSSVLAVDPGLYTLRGLGL